MEILGLVVLFIGVIFCALGVLGIMRFPDVYTRLHAAGLISTLGIVALGIGASLLMPSLTLKMIALVLFIVVVSPAGTQAIANAAYTAPERDEDGNVLPEAGD